MLRLGGVAGRPDTRGERGPGVSARKVILALLVLVSGLLVLEGAARFYVGRILRQERLFQNDAVLGWKPLPDLDRTRMNPEGGLWRVRTNSSGFRGPETWAASCGRRLLVLGDSFAFGDGLNIEDRFDTLILAARPTWCGVNLGVMGYSTDQELLAARAYLPDLTAGDAVIVLTCSDDFFDLMRESKFGRAKPRFSRQGEGLVCQPPRIGRLNRLRDHSYLAGRAMEALGIQQLRPLSDAEVEEGLGLYRELVRHELGPLAARGVIVILAWHDMRGVPSGVDAGTFFHALASAAGVLSVDLSGGLEECDCFFRDGHWNADGSRVVARILTPLLDAGG